MASSCYRVAFLFRKGLIGGLVQYGVLSTVQNSPASLLQTCKLCLFVMCGLSFSTVCVLLPVSVPWEDVYFVTVDYF